VNLHKRLQRLEVLEGQSAGTPDSPARATVRERMKAYPDEIAAAKREGRALSAEAEALREQEQRISKLEAEK
jgi:hypothetical protein